MPAINELQDFTTQVRRDMNRMVQAVQSGHPGVIRLVEFLTVLYQEIMDYSTDFYMDGQVR